MQEVLALLIPIIAVSIPIVAIITGHQRKVMEMKLQMGQRENQNVLAELRELKDQVSNLRDTTTRYDLSFDAALQRLEGRMANIEQRVTNLEHAEKTVPLQTN